MPRLPDSDSRLTVTFDFEGHPLSGQDGEPLACSLIAAGKTTLSRSIKYHRARGAYCFSKACSSCLVRVDGRPNVFACATPLRAGMKVERQNAFPTADFDIFRATDWLFPKGLDHHEMFAGVPIAEQVMLKVTRQLAGLGQLPLEPAQPPPHVRQLRTDALIVGGGPAGLAAAHVLSASKFDFRLMEAKTYLGGQLADGIPGPMTMPSSLPPEENVLLETTALGFYTDSEGPFLVALQNRGLILIRSRFFLMAQGGHPRALAFENGDLPGVYFGRAIAKLIRRHHVVPGRKFAVVGFGEEMERLAQLLKQAGAEVNCLFSGTPIAALGFSEVTGVRIQQPDGSRKEIECDAIAVCVPPAPSFELAKQAGAAVTFDETHSVFKVSANENGETSLPHVFAAGELTGPQSAEKAWKSGELAAQRLVTRLRAEEL